MIKNNILAIAVLSLAAGAAGACSSEPATSQNTTMLENSVRNVNSANAAANNAANGSSHTSSGDETPASVKAVFPEAQSWTKQHKDIPENAIARIEKETGGKVPDRDHHSYLAFGTAGGKRAQLGAATVVTAGGKEMIVVYESVNGMPTVKEVRGEGVPAEFLKQFAGKNHDAKIKFGEDIKAAGADEATAKAATEAVRIDVLTMEALYGAAHTH